MSTSSGWPAVTERLIPLTLCVFRCDFVGCKVEVPFETPAGLCGAAEVAVGSDGTRVCVCVVVPSQTGVRALAHLLKNPGEYSSCCILVRQCPVLSPCT